MSTCRIAVLISGGGTTLKNLIDQIATGKLDRIQIQRVVSSSGKAKGLGYAEEAGIPSRVIRTTDHDDAHSFSEAVFQQLRADKIDLVVMGGFLKHILIPDDFAGKVINIHPSLIPSFCGQGFYGLRVHEAVLTHGAKVSGCTVHFVDNEYDHGPIILQRCVEVLDNDTPSNLASRIFEEECEAYPEAIRLFAEGRLTIQDNRVQVRATP